MSHMCLESTHTQSKSAARSDIERFTKVDIPPKIKRFSVHFRWNTDTRWIFDAVTLRARNSYARSAQINSLVALTTVFRWTGNPEPIRRAHTKNNSPQYIGHEIRWNWFVREQRAMCERAESDTHRLFDARINATIHFHVWHLMCQRCNSRTGLRTICVFGWWLKAAEQIYGWHPMRSNWCSIGCWPVWLGPMVTPYLIIFYCLTSHARWHSTIKFSFGNRIIKPKIIIYRWRNDQLTSVSAFSPRAMRRQRHGHYHHSETSSAEHKWVIKSYWNVLLICVYQTKADLRHFAIIMRRDDLALSIHIPHAHSMSYDASASPLPHQCVCVCVYVMRTQQRVIFEDSPAKQYRMFHPFYSWEFL